MPRHGKFDSPAPGQPKLPSHMFHHVAELLNWEDMSAPAPSYSGSFDDWKEKTGDAISDVVAAGDTISGADAESFDIGKQIGFRALEKFLERATAVGWSSQSPEARHKAAEELLRRPQVPQRTQAWYEQGKQVLTASEFSKLLGTPRSVSQLVMSKVPTEVSQKTNRLACMSCEMGPFDWGVRFEPVVKQILTESWGVKIVDAGRIMHPTDSHIAASPDGIILDATDPARIGRLLEIKCPITRKIGEGVPFDYWCQMQIQMEVTGIDECEYVEVKLESIQGTTTDISGEAQGHVWLLQNPMTCEMTYRYTEGEAAALKTDGWHELEKIPWRLSKMYAVTVTRDRGWFLETAEAREKFWNDVELARKGAFQEVSGRVIVTKEPAGCMIIDTV